MVNFSGRHRRSGNPSLTIGADQMSALPRTARRAHESAEKTQILLDGLMEAVGYFSEAARIEWHGRGVVLRLSYDHYVILGPDEPGDEIDEWCKIMKGHWLAEFESVGKTLITHLVRN
jgi:hypothetical protein